MSWTLVRFRDAAVQVCSGCLAALHSGSMYPAQSMPVLCEGRERDSAVLRRHKRLQTAVVKPKQSLGWANGKVQLLSRLLAPAFTPRTVQGTLRARFQQDCSGWGWRSGAAAADVSGLLCLLTIQKGMLHLESFRKDSNLRLISNFWLH